MGEDNGLLIHRARLLIISTHPQRVPVVNAAHDLQIDSVQIGKVLVLIPVIALQHGLPKPEGCRKLAQETACHLLG